MPYVAYKLIHLLGIFTAIAALAAAGMHTIRGGTRADNPHRKLLGIVHGIAVFLILLGGFGMLARIGILHGGLPIWVYLKLAIWVMLGGAIAVVYRRAGVARMLLISLPLLGVLGAAIALYKPWS